MTKKLIYVLGLVLALPPTVASVGPAAAVVPAATAQVTGTYAFRFTFDNGESLSAGSRVVDTSGSHRDGTVRGANGGRLKSVNGYRGRSAQYPAVCRKASCARAIISIGDATGLNPGSASFDFGAHVRVTGSQVAAKRDSNLIQKGLWADSSQWKLQLDGSRGVPACVIGGMRSGTFHRVLIKSTSGIADGTWHALRCERTATTVRLVVDGKVKARASFNAVKLNDSSPVTIGGRAPAQSGNDQFFGTLDDVYMRRG